MRRIGEVPEDLRILVFATTGRDGELTCKALREAEFDPVSSFDLEQLCSGIQEGAGAVLIAQEALAASSPDPLLAMLARQPAWSDLPLIVFTGHDHAADRLLETLGTLANVTLLERPVLLRTMVSAARVALRARKRQYQVRELIAEQAEADRRKDEFLAMLGHELRNPLNAMRLALAADEGRAMTPADIARHRDVLARQTTNLARMLDDLLDVSRIARGKFALQRACVDLNAIVRRAIDAAERPALAHTHRLRSALASEPLPVDGDPVRLEQVVANLLTNAIKYTQAGGTIDVSTGIDADEAVVRVRDDGVGIAPDMLERVFEPFVQIDRTIERAQGGLGLGLPLVRKLIEMHGGHVHALSDGQGRGTEFVLRLPLADGPTETTTPTSALRDESEGSATPSARVLIVEDGDDNRDLLREMLSMWGHDVDVAADGREGLEKYLRSRPEIAIVDIGLPEMDGYEVARRIRAANLRPSPRLIAMTGYGQPEERQRALDAGFDRHIVKPVDLDALESVIREYAMARTGARLSREPRKT